MRPMTAPEPEGRESAAAAERRLLRLSPRDNVCAATASLARGTTLCFEGRTLVLADDVPLGHKVAVRPIARGEKVLKYGASIGTALVAIAAGEHVHVHNLASDYLPPAGRAGSLGTGAGTH